MLNVYLTPILRYSVFLVVMISLGACSLIPDSWVKPAESTPPETTRTEFTQGLRCFGGLTKAYGVSLLYVSSSDVEDATGIAGASGGEIPAQATSMLQSAIVGVGGKVVYVANYPVLSANLFKVHGLPLPKDNKQAPSPKIYMDATISAYDRAILNDRVGGSEDGEDGGFSVSRDLTSSMITVDINLLQLPSMIMAQRAQAVNSIELKDTRLDGDFDVTVFGVGIDFDASIKGLAARHEAVRSLLELGVIQSLGRYLTLPWWDCSPLHSKRDPVVVENLQNFYRSLDDPNRVARIQTELSKRGYPIAEANGELDKITIEAIQRFQLDRELPWEPQITEEFFITVMLTPPLTDATAPTPISFMMETLDLKELVDQANRYYQEENYSTASSWYRQAAEQGDAASQRRLGFMYQQGLGVNTDLARAKELFQKAADQGDTQAMVLLGLMFETGHGMPEEPGTAFNWYTRAAERDHPEGQYHLGRLYEEGIGVFANLEEAIEWYRKAAEGGDSKAQEALERLDK